MWIFEPTLSLDKLIEHSVGVTSRFTGVPEPEGYFRSVNDRVGGLVALGDLTGVSVMGLLLLKHIGFGSARRDSWFSKFRRYWCPDGFLVSSYYVLQDYDQAKLEDDSRRGLEQLFERGLITEGKNRLVPWRAEEGVVDLWEWPSYEVHDDSISLTDLGREICEHMESDILDAVPSGLKLVEGVLCMTSNRPPPFSTTCFRDCHDCSMWHRNGLPNAPQCEARLGLRWRPAWWRRPRIGYFILCRNAYDIAMQRGEGPEYEAFLARIDQGREPIE